MEKQPNIIFVLTDDQGAWAMHCAGNNDIRTPNLDYLAESGMRFDNFFCVSPVCSPARASILTGKIPSQHGIHDWIRSGNLDKELLGNMKTDPYYKSEDRIIRYLDGMTTYTDMLAQNGYTCALSGKWHMGDSRNPQHGFSKWFTIGRGGCQYYKADVVEEGRLYFETRYITDVITDKALDYMDELEEQEKPYYLSIHYTAPHDPWDEEQHPREYVEMYRDCTFTATPDLPVNPNQIPSAPSGTGKTRQSLLRGYYAAVTAMDANVGRVIQKLKERGEWENTILIFSSDNGMNMGHHGIWGKGNGTFPFNMYDTAVKVPFLIRIPGLTEEGKVVNSMHSHYDIIHTLRDILKLDTPLPENLPGSSFLRTLEGQESPEEEIVIFDEYGANRMIRTREWKYIRRYPYGPDELYHLADDPDEMKNLTGQPEYDAVKINLNEKLMTWFHRYVNPAVDGTKERVLGFGQLQKAGIYSEGKEAFAGEPKK